MADVFISYKAERRRAARHLSKVLGAHGYSVWFDYGLIPGDDFEPKLMAELGAAKVVVVLWCAMSVKSQWVHKEAHYAREHGKFLPCWIEEADLPDEFSGADTINLIAWDGGPRSRMLNRVIDDVGRRLGRDPAVNYRELRDLEDDWHDFGAPSLAQFALSDAPPAVREGPARPPAPAKAAPILGPPPKGLSQNLAAHWERAQNGDAAALFQVGLSAKAFDQRFGERAIAPDPVLEGKLLAGGGGEHHQPELGSGKIVKNTVHVVGESKAPSHDIA